jgi:hypothetical protein
MEICPRPNQLDEVPDEQSGFCLLYAMLIEQVFPIPLAEE